MTVKIKHKRGTASALASANPTPAAGELVFETDTRRFKLGDGSTAYTSLAYVAPNASDITSGTLNADRLPGIDAGEVVASGPTASLLLHFNGSQNGVDFLDSSSSSRTFTRGGNSVLRQEQKKFGSASGYFTGGTYIQTDAYAGVEFGASDFTIELWYYQLSNGTYSGLIGKGAQLSTASDVWSLEFGGAGLIFVPWVSTSSAVQCAQPSMNAWHHVAVVRNGTDLTLYVDGVSMSNTYFNATIPTNASAPLVIGAGWYQPTSRGYNGYIDELRVAKSAVWTANFTPPTSEF